MIFKPFIIKELGYETFVILYGCYKSEKKLIPVILTVLLVVTVSVKLWSSLGSGAPTTVDKSWWNILYGTFILHIPLFSIGFALRIKLYSGLWV